eukprot:scaffold19848_cov131-Isochrysis_galbana.AAC.3
MTAGRWAFPDVAVLRLGGCPTCGNVQVRALHARVRWPRPTPYTRGTAAARGAAHGGGSRRLLPKTHFLTPARPPSQVSNRRSFWRLGAAAGRQKGGSAGGRCCGDSNTGSARFARLSGPARCVEALVLLRQRGALCGFP